MLLNFDNEKIDHLMRVIIVCYLFIVISLVASLSSCRETKIYGTIKLNMNTYIDETEIDVKSWLSYYTWKLENEGIDSAIKVLPDSTAVDTAVWRLIKLKYPYYSYSEGTYSLQPLGYFSQGCENTTFDCSTPIHCLSMYLLYPITGITYEQVEGFCRWRTRVYNNIPSIKKTQKHFTFRLPSEEEWKSYAILGFNENELLRGLADSVTINVRKNGSVRRCALFNYKNSQFCGKTVMSSVVRVSCSFPNINNVIGLFGNVSEMTVTKGLSKGGNYLLYAKQCHPDSVQYYSKPEKWLGFRCIVTVEDESE